MLPLTLYLWWEDFEYKHFFRFSLKLNWDYIVANVYWAGKSYIKYFMALQCYAIENGANLLFFFF